MTWEFPVNTNTMIFDTFDRVKIVFFFLNQHVEKMATNYNIYCNFIVPVHSAHLGHRSRHEVSQTRFFVYSVTRHCGHYIKQQLKLNSDE